MSCDLCHDTEGPFLVAEVRRNNETVNVALKLVCERCFKKIEREKKNGTTNIRNKRHGDRISRTNGRSKRRTDEA